MFKAHLTFTKEYPQKPPKMQFVTDMWHPNSKCAILESPLMIYKLRTSYKLSL